MAVCGLDCGSCEIANVESDADAAESVTSWFRGMGWLKEGEGVSDVVAKAPYCKGCHGDRATHWSADCWILKCCVDEKGLEHCSECDEFVCERLEKWSGGSERYAEALERLKQRKGEST
jgi:hypothetical protein